MKKNLSIILSLLVLVGVADGRVARYFIGVMVGILVTFAVGWQIINALEIKSKLAEIERLKAEIDAQHAQIEKIAARSAFDTAVNALHAT